MSSTATTRQPASLSLSLLVPHGAPTLALEPGPTGAALARLAAGLPRPRAIVIVSAHWSTPQPTVGFAAEPATIHDFGGFPDELYDIRYPAHGSAEVAGEVLARLQAAGLHAIGDPQRGLDHGAWLPLRLMYPQAGVPVIPLSIQAARDPAHHLAVGRALAPLAAQGVLVIGSGNLTHNLHDYMRIAAQDGATPAYVREFADWFWQRLERNDIAALLDYRRRAPAALQAHPSDEHLLPLYVALGAAGEAWQAARFHQGVADYVLAMDAYAFSSAA